MLIDEQKDAILVHHSLIDFKKVVYVEPCQSNDPNKNTLIVMDNGQHYISDLKMNKFLHDYFSNHTLPPVLIHSIKWMLYENSTVQMPVIGKNTLICFMQGNSHHSNSPILFLNHIEEIHMLDDSTALAVTNNKLKLKFDTNPYVLIRNAQKAWTTYHTLDKLIEDLQTKYLTLEIPSHKCKHLKEDVRSWIKSFIHTILHFTFLNQGYSQIEISKEIKFLGKIFKRNNSKGHM